MLLVLLCFHSPMDFAQSVAFENADIGQCPDLGPHHEREDEEQTPETTSRPEPENGERKASTTSPPPPPLPPFPVSISVTLLWVFFFIFMRLGCHIVVLCATLTVFHIF